MKLFLNYLLIAMLGLGLAACNEATEDEGTDEEQTEETSEEEAAMTACDPGCEMVCCDETSKKSCDKMSKEDCAKKCPMMQSKKGCEGMKGHADLNTSTEDPETEI
jgi:hypothetical protein